MRTYTQKCRQHGPLEISVECEDASVLSVSVRWLIGWIESEVACGRRFLPEQTIQVGWSLVEIRQRSDGTLALFEPDFKSMLARFVDGVSNTLLHLFLQKSVAESLGLEQDLAIPPLRDNAIVCSKFGSSEGFVMSRFPPKAADSGWFFGCDSREHDHQRPDALRRISLYEEAIRHDDRITPFLGLAPDAFVGFAGGVPATDVEIHSNTIRHDVPYLAAADERHLHRLRTGIT